MAPPTSLGTYRCSNCANQIDVARTPLPLCPNCGNAEWETMIGGNGGDDEFAELRSGVEPSGERGRL